MGLSREDAAAIAASAGRLGLDPHSFGALMELESGINPNIWGGAGGQYVGLIQFGPGARKEVGLPSGPMTIQQQLPYVEKYFSQRGYKPGGDPSENIKKAYRTVLVGNPYQSGTDSFGTNSDSAAKRMLPGGDLYKRAAGKLGQLSGLSASVPATTPDVSPSPNRGRSGFGDALAAAILGESPKKKESRRFAAMEEAPRQAFAEITAEDRPERMAGGPGVMGLLNLGNSSSKDAPNPWLEAIGGETKTTPEPETPQVETLDPGVEKFSAVTSGGTAGELSIVDLGKRLQGLGLKVAEHPEFGGVGRHSPRSHHYAGNALDLTIQKGSPLLAGMDDSAWPEVTAKYGEKLRKAFPGAEIFHPKYDPVGGHHEHIHIAFPGGRSKYTPFARQVGFVG